MNKVQSLEDLRKMREQLRSDLNMRENCNNPESLPQIRVSMGTCGIATGAKEVMSAFVDMLAERNINAVVTQSGCMGYCESEPTLEITVPGRDAVIFGNVTPARVSEIIEKYILRGELVEGIIPCRYNTLL